MDIKVTTITKALSLVGRLSLLSNRVVIVWPNKGAHCAWQIMHILVKHTPEGANLRGGYADSQIYPIKTWYQFYLDALGFGRSKGRITSPGDRIVGSMRAEESAG